MLEGFPHGHGLPHDNPKGKDVDTKAIVLTEYNLRRHVPPRTGQSGCMVLVRSHLVLSSELLGQAKVKDLGIAADVEPDVVGLQIAEDDPVL